MFFYFNVLCNAFCYFFEVQFDLYPKVTPTYPSRTPSALGSATTSKKTTENILAKNIPELTEDIFHIHSAPISTTAITTNARVSVTIILCFLISIT